LPWIACAKRAQTWCTTAPNSTANLLAATSVAAQELDRGADLLVRAGFNPFIGVLGDTERRAMGDHPHAMDSDRLCGARVELRPMENNLSQCPVASQTAVEDCGRVSIHPPPGIV